MGKKSQIGKLHLKDKDFILLTWGGDTASVTQQLEPGISIRRGCTSNQFNGVEIQNFSMRAPESIARILSDEKGVPEEFVQYVLTLGG
jgi:hypothetical protein